MLFPSVPNQLTTEPLLWCSHLCRGNPAEYNIKFKIDDEMHDMKLCRSCYQIVMDKGPFYTERD